MYGFFCSILNGFMHLFFRVRVKGIDNIPKDGGAILCANHISNWDAVLVQGVVKRHIYFMAKEELFHVPLLSLLVKAIGAIPVKREGSDLTAVKRAFKTVGAGEILGIFPTGQREKSKGEGDVKAGVGLIAGKTKAPVIPVHIKASYKIFSKVEVCIGRPEVFIPDEGEKLNGDVAKRLSDDIYKRIKDL